MSEYPIIVTDQDISRLRGLLGGRGSSHDQHHLLQLQSELENAVILPSDEVPAGVITIDSRVRVVDLDSGKRSVLTIVLPNDADIAERRVSVLAPIGTALLGFCAGDDVEWPTPFGTRRLHIEHVMQPHQVAAAQRVRVSRKAPHNSPGVQ